MSAIGLIIRDGYVLMAGDGAASDPATDAIVAEVSKLTAIPSLDAVIGITGVGGFGHLMQWFMPCAVRSFDDLVDHLAQLVRHVHDHMIEHHLIVGADSHTNVVVAGWSDRRQKFEGWRVVTFPKHVTNHRTGETGTLQPWTLLPMPETGSWCSAAVNQTALRRFGVISDHDQDDIEKLTRLICAARSDSGLITDGGYRFNAGVFVELALVQRGQIQSWITHRWPEDALGMPIDPALGNPLPQHLMDKDAQA